MHHMKGWLHGRGHGAIHGLGHEVAHDSGGDGVHESGRHPVNVTHLVMGVAFLGIVAVWALVTSDTLELADAGWLVPAPFVLAGALGLVASVAGNARRRRTHP